MGPLPVRTLDPGLRDRLSQRSAGVGRLDDILDPLQGLAHVADVPAPAQLAAQHREEFHGEGIIEPKRFGDIGSPRRRT